MLGPNSDEVESRKDTSTDGMSLEYIIDTARKSLPGFNIKKRLQTFSGIHPTPSTGDFIIKEEYEEPLAETSICIKNNCCIRLLCHYLELFGQLFLNFTKFCRFQRILIP